MPTYTYTLTPNVFIQTVVTSVGSGQNNVATVNILFGQAQQWTGTMVQASPTVVTPLLHMGEAPNTTDIAAGSTFTLTVPTPVLSGNVVANLTYTSTPNPPSTFNGQVATWTMTST
jgi:hypothetical protein